MQDRVDKRVEVLFLHHKVHARAYGIDAHLLIICAHTASQRAARKQHMPPARTRPWVGWPMERRCPLERLA